MARDPPAPIAGSELRDLSLTPSHIRSAAITITHQQLRDLILPLERGHVLYPRGMTIEEQRWTPPPDIDSDDEVSAGPSKLSPDLQAEYTKTFAHLGFKPNCLTARGQIMACGGQHGELFMTNLPYPPSPKSLAGRYQTNPRPVKPFRISGTIPTVSINNSVTILPCYPDEWRDRELRKRLSHIDRFHPSPEEEEEYERERQEQAVDEDDEDDDELEDGLMEDRVIYRDALEEDMMMDIDEDDAEETLHFAGSPTSSVATYPNTVPFLHAPRILGSPTADAGTHIHSRRSTSFGGDERMRPRRDRVSFSSSMEGPSSIQFVSSLPAQTGRLHGMVPEARFGWSSDASSTGTSRKSRYPPRNRKEEPRVLISNNDQTVKMFSLRSYQHDFERQFTPPTSNVRYTASMDHRLHQYISSGYRRPSVPAPPPRFGSGFGYDAIGMNAGIRETRGDELTRELARTRQAVAEEAEALRRDREEFERVVGMRVPAPASGPTVPHESGFWRTSSQDRPASSDGPKHPSKTKEDKEIRRLAKVGEKRFECAINHSSLSPDLRTMVSVGDSNDVHLFDVIDGGRNFKRVATYQINPIGESGYGFSSAWSKDGRKFAVASQDGQVTVWDHRSSKPMNRFYTSRTSSSSYAADIASRISSGSYRHRGQDYYTEVPPESLASPGHTREPARVVKFSPEGSGRDLMVFTEDYSHIHIIDAKTFTTHVKIPVPAVDPEAQQATTARMARHGQDGGAWGIAGVAFDPTGDWLYSGTEKTIVEWDMRRLGGGGEGGTWGMA